MTYMPYIVSRAWCTGTMRARLKSAHVCTHVCRCGTLLRACAVDFDNNCNATERMQVRYRYVSQQGLGTDTAARAGYRCALVQRQGDTLTGWSGAVCTSPSTPAAPRECARVHSLLRGSAVLLLYGTCSAVLVYGHL